MLALLKQVVMMKCACLASGDERSLIPWGYEIPVLAEVCLISAGHDDPLLIKEGSRGDGLSLLLGEVERQLWRRGWW